MDKEELELKIAKKVGRNYCVLVGRATTAIYLAIKAFNFNNGNIIIPSIVCPNPIFAVLYNDLSPKFCDINLKDFTIDISSFKNTLDEHTKAVIPINLYGYPANYDDLIPLCKKEGIKIIEDAAQSFGGYNNDKPLGSFGDISVISFGHTKITDIGSGGAVLTDNLDLYNKIKLENDDLGKKPKDYKIKAELYQEVYYALQPFWQRHDELYYLYSTFPTIFKSLYLFKFQKELIPILDEQVETLDKEVRIRKKNARIYRDHLKKSSKLILPEYEKDNGVPWRFSFLLKENNQINVSKKLRENNIDVSNWYPSTHKMFLPQKKNDKEKFKNANYLEKHVLNFWVHSGITEESIKKTCKALLELL